MKNNSRIERIFSYFNAIRGNNTPEEFQSVLAILKKLMEIEVENEPINKLDDNALYSIMQSIAQDFGMDNPFSDEEHFLSIYRDLQRFDEISWADIIEYGDPRAKFRVPESIVDEMEENFIEGFQEVLIAEAEKFALSLERLVANHYDSHFTLTTMDNLYYQVLNQMFYDNEMVDVIQTSIYHYEFSSDKFDLILSVPVFGVRDMADDDSEFICREYDLIATENLALHLRSDGILSIVLPAKITYAGGRVKELREFIQSMYCLREIAELPFGIFENIGVKTLLFNIATGRTDEVIVKRYAYQDENALKTGNKKLVVQDDTFVLEDELTDMGSWNVDRIFESQDEDWIKFQESNVKKQELGTVATIFRGKNVNKKDPNGGIGIVNISNIGDYEVDYSSLDHFDDEERKVSNYLLQTGDLLIPARGTVIRTAIFEEQSYPCIASSNIIVIRAQDERLSTIYLKIFFDSPLGKKMLKTRQQGTFVMNISYKDLNAIEIPLPSISEQKSIADEYTRELETYKKAIKTAEDRWSLTISNLQERI